MSSQDNPVTERSAAQLVGDLTEQTKRLVRTEAHLAAREMTAKAKRGAVGIGAFSVAGVLAGYAGLTFLLCVVLALSTVMANWLAALLVAAALLVMAGIAALIGRSGLRKALPPVPEKTIERVREDIAVVNQLKEHP
ncbi:phage holin family protein [Allokutzneria oryzae]|uniref:Phage holin family protein n=1 Tax=Allokutzneria oryzae TaxID=1378989 RepID=A0ABV6A9R9_9PSEU